MSSLFSLAIKDMRKRWGLMLVLTALFAVVFAAFLVLFTHYKSATQIYGTLSESWLVVGSSDGLSEIHGSRLTPEIREMLIESGYADPVPEIHQIVGTTIANGTLVKGIRLEDYEKYNSFSLHSGRKLAVEDADRLAMIGETLARTHEINTGDDILLRGRKFRVVGIFKTGSIQDNEAWISLEDAQRLLNYGDDVSLYLIPDGGPLKVGDLISEDVLVSQKGESGGIYNSSVSGFFKFFGVVGGIVGVASAITLGNMLWRLAFLRRREFGILKSIGFGIKGLALYFFTQAGLIVVIGSLAGIGIAVVIITTLLRTFTAFGGFSIATTVDVPVLLQMTLLVMVFFGISSLIPLHSVYKSSITDLLGRN
ncbi:MAG TPA: FtsX-like permease family protein [Anaerolineaceae bacterium]|nr:FtsX-like permease family protein [Anaerolineaceae bacterium]